MKGVVVPVRGLGVSRDRSCESHFCSTDRLQSRGRRRSCRDLSRSPSARVWSRRFWSQSSDSYWSRRVRSHSRSDRSRSRRLRSRSSGRCEAQRDRSWSNESRYRSHDRRRSRDCSPISSDRSRSRDHEEAVVASQDRGNSGLRVEPAPAVAGSSIPRLTPSFPDLSRLFTAAGVTGAGMLPGPASPVTSAAPVACSSVSVPALGVVTPTGAASATGSPGRHERARESSHPERRRRRSSGRERSRSGGKCGKS